MRALVCLAVAVFTSCAVPAAPQRLDDASPSPRSDVLPASTAKPTPRFTPMAPRPAIVSPLQVPLFPPVGLVHGVLTGSGGDGSSWTDEIWSAGRGGARVEFGDRNIGGQSRGDLIVYDGSTLIMYSASRNDYAVETNNTAYHVLGDLLWEHWIGRCKDASAGAVPMMMGRPTLFVDCGGAAVWIDRETGVVLRSEQGFFIRQLTRVDYPASFPRELFMFVPPPGAVPRR